LPVIVSLYAFVFHTVVWRRRYGVAGYLLVILLQIFYKCECVTVKELLKYDANWQSNWISLVY